MIFEWGIRLRITFNEWAIIMIETIFTVIFLLFALVFVAIAFVAIVKKMFFSNRRTQTTYEQVTHEPTLDELLRDYDLTDTDLKEIGNDEKFHEILLEVMFEMWRNGGIRRTSYAEIYSIFKHMYKCRRGINGISTKLLDKFASQFATRHCRKDDFARTESETN